MKILLLSNKKAEYEDLRKIINTFNSNVDILEIFSYEKVVTSAIKFNPDLIIMDIGADYLEAKIVLKHLKLELSYSPKIYVLSECLFDIIKNLFISLGVAECFDKSLDADLMISCLKKELDETNWINNNSSDEKFEGVA
jgi:DNA-binding response OmpR family regulator